MIDGPLLGEQLSAVSMDLGTDDPGSAVGDGPGERSPSTVIEAADAKTRSSGTAALAESRCLVALRLFLSQLAQMGCGTALVAYLILAAHPGAAFEGTRTSPESEVAKRICRGAEQSPTPRHCVCCCDMGTRLHVH